TEEILSERKRRIQNYCNALESLIVYLRDKDIVPILMTPLCYNEDMVERQDVKTERDNKEKCAIKNTLFTKASFKNINIGQKIICEKGKSIADKYRVQVWDAYSFTKEKVDGSCFYDDGVHYNEKGHRIIAELIYEKMFGEPLRDYTIEKRVKDISNVEADERAYYFVKYNLIFFAYGTKQGKDLADALNGFIKEKGYVEGLTKERAEGFFRFAQDTVLNTRRIIGKVTDMFTR
ncbi:MAG: SGNH/GDSL hydrolase family protein, partial [Clostridia bacterium]|nr:SGNH/GDSL hydrolase family protein [Clostridia bacterium]